MIDSVTREVVRNSLVDITREMKAVVMRSAPTTIWKESGDLSCGILDSNCELVAQGPQDLPAHLATMPFSAKGVLDNVPGELQEGDVFFQNDPCAGNNHLPDCLMLMPVFVEGALLAFTAVRGHWADIGGIGPGSYTTLTTDSLQEGLRIPPIRIYRQGRLDEQLLKLILANVRGAELRREDFFAQFAGCNRGAARFSDLCQKYGSEVIRECMSDILDHGERLTRAEIEKIPDGNYTFEDQYDGDGIDDVRLKVVVKVQICGSDVLVDLTGSSSQATGGMNAPFAVTCSAVQYAIKAITDPWNAPNSGSYRPVKVQAPYGCMFNPVLPAPVIGCNSEVGIILSDAVLGALAPVCEDRVAAGSCGSGAIVAVGGKRPKDGSQFYFLEALGSAGGARSDADGWDGYRVGVGNMGITSLEIIETEIPIRTVCYEFAQGWGGPGKFRGGIPGRHAFELLADATVTITGERSMIPAFGLSGGRPGKTAEYILNPGGLDERRLFSKTPPTRLKAGTIVSVTSAGGGGFGPASRRKESDRKRDRGRLRTGSIGMKLNKHQVEIHMRTLRKIAIGAAVSALALLPRSVDAQTALKYGLVNPPSHISVDMAKKFGEELSQATAGKFKVDAYPAGQLVRSDNWFQGVRLGTVDFASGALSLMEGIAPEITILDAPYIFNDLDHARRVLDGAFTTKLNDKLTKSGVRILAWWLFGVRSLATTFPVKSPADLAGRKIRDVPSPVLLATIEGMGANPIPLDISEVHTALQTGVVVGIVNPPDTIFNNGFYEETKFFSMTGHTTMVQAIVMNEQKFQSFPKDVQSALLATAKSAADWQWKTYISLENEYIEKLRGKGMTIITEADGLKKSEFKEKSQALVMKKYLDQWGAGTFEQIKALGTPR